MPFDYIFDADSQILTIIGTEPSSMDQRYECIQRIMNDPILNGRIHVLIDISRITATPTPDNARSVVTLIQLLIDKFMSRVAIMHNRVGHATTTHLVALYANRNQYSVRAFLDNTAARDWLLGAA